MIGDFIFFAAFSDENGNRLHPSLNCPAPRRAAAADLAHRRPFRFQPPGTSERGRTPQPMVTWIDRLARSIGDGAKKAAGYSCKLSGHLVSAAGTPEPHLAERAIHAMGPEGFGRPLSRHLDPYSPHRQGLRGSGDTARCATYPGCYRGPQKLPTIPRMAGESTSTFARRLRAAFTARKIPAWVFILYAIFREIPDFDSRIRFWLETTKYMGGYLGTVAAVLASPYFAPGLAGVAVLYLLFVGEPKKGVQRHVFWPYAAWIVLALCVSALAITAGWGAIEIYVRQEGNKIALGIPRGAPGEPGPQSQVPLYDSDFWGLTSDQLKILLTELPKLKPYVKIVWLSSASTDNQAGAFLSPLMQIIDRSGLSFGTITQSPRDPSEEGLMLAVSDINNPSIGAQKVREAFEVANIHLRLISLPDSLKLPDRDFVIFIGPRPIKWR
jgi:hypothetical protein